MIGPLGDSRLDQAVRVLDPAVFRRSEALADLAEQRAYAADFSRFCPIPERAKMARSIQLSNLPSPNNSTSGEGSTCRGQQKTPQKILPKRIPSSEEPD